MALSFIVLNANAQLINNGGKIIVNNGALIKCNGDFINTSGAVINDGKIEVQGNFISMASYNSTVNDDSLIISGAGISSLHSNGDTLNYLSIDKSSNLDSVLVNGTVVIGVKLDYHSGLLSTNYGLNPTFLLSALNTTIFNFTPGREIIGKVMRTGWVNGSPVVFNSAHMQITTNDGTSPSNITVTMLPQAFEGDPSQEEKEVKRKFFFAQHGGSGFKANIQFPYDASELNNNEENKLIPWVLIDDKWTPRTTSVTRNLTENWVATAGVEATSFGQEWKLADASENPLPVRFTQFDVVCSTNGTIIKWSTAMESNNNYYLVEKSTTGDSWKTIGRVVPSSANSSTAKSYQFKDSESGAALYRIKQVDIDGAFNYTGIVRTYCNENTFFVNLYPVPAKDKITLVIGSNKAKRTTLMIIDNNGRVVLNVPLNINKGTTYHDININHLAQGHYHIKVGKEDAPVYHRFLISR